MKNLLKLLLTAPLAVLALPTLAQQEHIGKLEVEKNEIYVAQATDLRIDTLILHQNASIRFAAGEHSTLQVQHGFIGKDCVILSAGENGMRGKLGADGIAGTDAGSLAIDIHLEQLGSLTIDTRGGNGGDG
ncbi:hypothetical protein [Pontibacter anaerobius]|uniref:Auto-transporter adhesin head GIN domain-containing protein n=1 Tax=Pontibacter anaerobius TaxID=2993940 RepID=A0ABT3RFE3_9BACT|nr:hypothetical protein [Pontibacter anaerobius]MCX2740077.1 hypothetical protein [Pontibacter anaerobius]